MEHQSKNFVLHEGLDQDKEKLNGAKVQKVLSDGEAKNEGESGQGQPGSGAAAADQEGAEEFSGEGGPAAGSAGLMGNRNQENRGTNDSGQDNEKQPEKPVSKDMEVIENVQAFPGADIWSTACSSAHIWHVACVLYPCWYTSIASTKSSRGGSCRRWNELSSRITSSVQKKVNIWKDGCE